MSNDVSKYPVLLMRTCAADGTSYGGFLWPAVGEEAVAPDWDPTPECGHGLHGLLGGVGDGTLLNWDAEALWLALEADACDLVDLGGKVKVPRARVVCRGTRHEVTAYIVERCPGAAIVGALVTAGDEGTATAGYGGTATAGDRGVLCLWWYDGSRRRLATAYVGECGIEANVAYRLHACKWMRADRCS